MIISLNWIRDFVDLPADLDPRELAERFTRTTAEVDAVVHLEVNAKGLIAARINSIEPISGTRDLHHLILDVGGGRTCSTVSAALGLSKGETVVYAPVGASVKAVGEIKSATVAGQPSEGMILPGESIGVEMAVQEAIVLSSDVEPGTMLDPGLFDDWLIEVDNKSITHRPDLWGHYGIAREIAAIQKCPFQPYPGVALDELSSDRLPVFTIGIDDAQACRRYSGLLLRGVDSRPAPLWLQLRLGHIGLRPINGLVDLTNYIMADLGQPMHAFDAAKVSRIEVGWAKDGEVFRTLDGVDRKLTKTALMIKCEGRSVAIGGVMGGLDSEVTESTTELLLESANFDGATIRRTAIGLGLRTDASARFEKSVDPNHTALSIQRFVQLARDVYPEFQLASRFSDCYPRPLEPAKVFVNPKHVARTLGREVPTQEMEEILTPLGFEVSSDAIGLHVKVPSFRAGNDVTIEEDVVEEVARFIGYDTFEPAMPEVTVRRFEINKLHELEQRSLGYFSSVERFVEIQGYLWYDEAWLEQIGLAPGTCVTLNNPAAEGLAHLRKTLMPGMLAAVVRNRFYFSAFSLLELGSVFQPDSSGDREHRHFGLIKARRGKRVEAELYGALKGAIERWSWQRFAKSVTFRIAQPDANLPWQHAHRTATIEMAGQPVGQVGVIALPLRRAMDEHLGAWGIAWAEIRLSGLETLPPDTERMGTIPPHPLVEMDFSLVVPNSTRFEDVAAKLTSFQHPLLKSVAYVGSYEGGSIGKNERSLTFRTIIGHRERTLVEEDVADFRREFESSLQANGYTIRK